MKNIFFLLVIAICAYGQTTAAIISANTPNEVLKSFQAKFPNVQHIKWEKENATEYEAAFEKDGTKMSAKFDQSGKWLETETAITQSTLPAAVQKTINEKYSTYKLKNAENVQTSDKGNIYEVEFAKSKDEIEVRFAPDGKVISEQKGD